MAVCLANNGTALTRADIYYNDNGTIKSIDDMEVWAQNGDSMYKFPQKDHCFINLDHTSFSTNKLEGASTYLTRDFELWQDTTKYNNLGDLVTIDPVNQSGFKVNNIEKYWWINNTTNTNIYYRDDLSANNRQFTISITCKFAGNPINWRDLWLFENNDQFRLEWGDNTLHLFGENNLLPQFMFPIIDRTNYFTITVVVNGRNVTGYQNDSQAISSTFSRDLAADLVKMYLCNQRGSSGTGSFGTGVYIKNLTLWNTNLSSQEVNDYHKFIGVI